MFDNEFGWQLNRPLFVKVSFSAFGKQWNNGQEFNWQTQPCRDEDYRKILRAIQNLYKSGKVHHDTTKEKQNKVGDRLSELNVEQLQSLVRQVNVILKKRCVTDKEFQDKRIKQSKLVDKQRGIIRTWIYSNHWALDEYTTIRDSLLDKANSKPAE